MPARNWRRANDLRKIERGRNRPVPLSTIPSVATGRCWCGEPLNHDWPGKSEDLPHPR